MMREQIIHNEDKIKAKAQQEIDTRLSEDFMDSYTVAEKIAETYKEIVIDAIATNIRG